MKLCTGISELNHASVVQKHTSAKKDGDMEKSRSEAPRGMLFEGLLERLVRQIVENVDAKNIFDVSVFVVPEKGSRTPAGSAGTWGCGPFN